MIERGGDWDRFVGRREELRRLEFAWRDIRHGRGSLVTVTGPAGVGKTRFCEEGAAAALRAGLKVVWGRCWADAGAPALWPWQPILSELGGPSTAALLKSEAGLDAVDPERFSRFLAISDRLAEACANSPTYLVIDDLHAADPGAVLLTGFLAKSLHRLPLVLVLTRRPEQRTDVAETPLLAELEREAIPLVLRHFEPDETRAYLTAHGLARLDSTLAMAIHRITDGNPLFLRRLVALGAADRAGGLPDGLRDAIDRSLRQLGPPAAGLLAISAVLGGPVSVAEAAALADARPGTVLEAIRAAAEAGLVTTTNPAAFEFSHDLVRQALVAELTPAQRLDAHARAARIVVAGSGDRLARQAHHAVNAAARSAEDARWAVVSCRAAAAHMVGSFAYERAASLLATAVELGESAGLGPAPAELLLAWADAVLVSGRLAEARPLFDRAADAARAEHDPILFAEAALGLGGIWVNEHRDRMERQRVLALQREALAELPAGQAILRCRLKIRQAAEQVYSGGPLAAVLTAVDEIRRLDDACALAEALSLCHHAMLKPEHTRERLALAEELLSVTAGVPHMGLLALQGLCWQTVDLFHLGDPRAGRALTELRARADLLDCHSVRFIVAALDVMLLIRAGRLDEAEDQAAQCFQLGTRVGDADAFAYYGAHLLVIRWLQGRGAELVDLADEIANSPTLTEAEFTFRATVARLAADAGQHDRARSALDQLTTIGLTALPSSSTWLAGMLAIVEAAAALGEADVARQAYELLLPFAELPTTASLAVVCFGSTERSLGVAAMTFGDLDSAVGHLQRAITANLRIANRPLTACCKADLADVLRRRGAPGDRRLAAELLRGAIDDANSLRLTGRAESWTAALGAPHRTSITVQRQAGRWLIRFEERQVLVGDLLGMRYLAQLLARPGVPIPAADLAYGGDSTAAPTLQAVLDDQARTAYAARAQQLADELAEARERADVDRVERLRSELDALAAELGHATGLGGRSRAFTGPAERARTAVRKAIKRAIDAVQAADPALAATLRAEVSTGYRCCYTPGGTP